MPPPSFMRLASLERGIAIICSYQRLVRSTNSSISLSRRSTTGSNFWSLLTQQKLNWKPTGPGLIADLDRMDYAQA